MILLTTVLQAVAAAASGKSLVAIGAALAVFGAAWGLGRIGQSSLESIARQPQAAGDIRSTMIIIGALVEGVALFAVIVCLLALYAK